MKNINLTTTLLKNIAFLFIFGSLTLNVNAQATSTTMRGLSSLEITAEMAPGVNLWNTLDAVCWWCPNSSNGLVSETVWGNPYTKPETMQTIASRGFKSIRIPVTWFNHMGPAPDYKIDKAWMDRVEDVVNYALKANLYAIINIHHDDYKSDRPGSWLVTTAARQAVVTNQIEKVWSQIATRFKDYGDYLIFETMNEPREVGSKEEWTGGSKEHRDVMNALNLAVVNTIRSTGGNNLKRFIMLPQVGANVNSALENMIIPNGDKNTIVAVHAYSPYNFCLNESGTNLWGTTSEITEIRNMATSLKNKFVSQGIGVVMGEWGAIDKDNIDQRINYYQTYSNLFKANSITTMAWIYSLNRQKLTWDNPLLEEAILQAYKPDYVYAGSLTLDRLADTVSVGQKIQLSAKISPENTSTKEIAWTSSNKNIATVSATGLITAKARGYVKITAVTLGKQATFNLIVQDDKKILDFHYEAEDFTSQSGIQSETCSDTGGGKNIGYIDTGDWSSYFIMVDSTGVYNFTARVATATNGGSFNILANNVVVGKVNVESSKSKGWQDWYTTTPLKIELKKGIYEIRLNYTGAFNINWFKINLVRQVPSSVINEAFLLRDIQVFPNPANGFLNIGYNLASQSDIEIKLVNMLGNEVKRIYSNEKASVGKHQINYSCEALPKGLYFVIFTVNNETTARKIAIN